MKPIKYYATQSFKVILGFLAIATLLLWGWNNALPDLFGLPAMQFKHSVALLLLVGMVSSFITHGRRHGASCQAVHRHHDAN